MLDVTLSLSLLTCHARLSILVLKVVTLILHFSFGQVILHLHFRFRIVRILSISKNWIGPPRFSLDRRKSLAFLLKIKA
jgi:hypothetical protein